MNNIPPIFRLNAPEKDLSEHLFSKEEKKFLVNFVSTFNVDGKRVCSIYNLSYDALYSLKKKYPANFDPISLLNEDFSIRNSSVVTLSSEKKSTPDTSKLSSLTTTSKPSTTTNDQIKIRRKPFSQTTAKNQRKVVSELSSSISRYTLVSDPLIQGYPQNEKEEIFQASLRGLLHQSSSPQLQLDLLFQVIGGALKAQTHKLLSFRFLH